MAGIDLYKPSGLGVIEQQLAPFLVRRTALGRPEPAVSPVLPPSCATLVVVPLARTQFPRVLLANLLQDPLAPHEALLFVCGDNWTAAAMAALADTARFYGAQFSIATVEARASASAALRVAATLPTVEQVLLVGPGVVGRAPGWRRALEQIARDGGGTACVSPSILYEDASVQFAGCGRLEPLVAIPYVTLSRPFAGFPASFVAPGPAVVSAGVSSVCCLLPRWVVDFISAVAAPVAAAGEPDLDFLLHIQSATPDCLWAPAVQVYSPEEAPSGDLALSAERLVARWCVRAAISGKGA